MAVKYEWRTGKNCVYKLYVHLVFVTKYRRGVFSPKLLKVLHSVFLETMEQMGGSLIEFGGEDDHVHLLVEANPATAISSLAGKLKGKSSYVLRRDHFDDIKNKLWGQHFWSPSYCAVSAGGAPLEIIRGYIEKQRAEPGPKQVAQSKKLRTRNIAN